MYDDESMNVCAGREVFDSLLHSFLSAPTLLFFTCGLCGGTLKDEFKQKPQSHCANLRNVNALTRKFFERGLGT